MGITYLSHPLPSPPLPPLSPAEGFLVLLHGVEQCSLVHCVAAQPTQLALQLGQLQLLRCCCPVCTARKDMTAPQTQLRHTQSVLTRQAPCSGAPPERAALAGHRAPPPVWPGPPVWIAGPCPSPAPAPAATRLQRAATAMSSRGRRGAHDSPLSCWACCRRAPSSSSRNDCSALASAECSSCQTQCLLIPHITGSACGPHPPQPGGPVSPAPTVVGGD